MATCFFSPISQENHRFSAFHVAFFFCSFDWWFPIVLIIECIFIFQHNSEHFCLSSLRFPLSTLSERELFFLSLLQWSLQCVCFGMTRLWSFCCVCHVFLLLHFSPNSPNQPTSLLSAASICSFLSSLPCQSFPVTLKTVRIVMLNIFLWLKREDARAQT